MKSPDKPESKKVKDISESFTQIQQPNEVSDILKELFEESKIHMITELSKDEIRLATRIYAIAKLKKIKAWEDGLAFYCKLMLSKDRAARKEIIMAINGVSARRSFMGRMFNRQPDMQPMNPMGGFR